MIFVGDVQKACPRRGQSCAKQGRRHIGARSVRLVREHGKGPRTPLTPPIATAGACFFDIPLVRKAGGMVTRVTARYNLVRKE